MSWPTIKVPGPKESGKWTRGRITILCFSFTDTYPRRLNNFLWKVRGWPVISWISTLWARGGLYTCRDCKKYIWPHHTCIDNGNMLDDSIRYDCGSCGSKYLFKENQVGESK